MRMPRDSPPPPCCPGCLTLDPTTAAVERGALPFFRTVSQKVPDVRFYKQTGDINKIPWSGLFGTGGYIAPEIMSQQPFGKPADLW